MHTISSTTQKLPPLTPRLTWIMAIASGVSIANIYYIQPLLSLMSKDYGVTESAVGLVATMTQLGLALGLLLILPLADIVEKKRLILTMNVAAILALIGIYAVPQLTLVTFFSCVLGFTSVIPQLMIPLSAALSSEKDRGAAIGKVMSGLLIGILLSRVLSGYLGEFGGWRLVYACAVVWMVLLLLLLWRTLPVVPPLSSLSYYQALCSLGTLLRSYPVLQEAAVIGAMIFFAFSAFWTGLSFLLEGAPYYLGADAAGSFGLAGVVGALFSTVAGKVSDAKGPRFTIGINILVIALSFVIFLVWGFSLIGLVVGVILLDLGDQCCNVSCQARIHQLSDTARSRITAVYMVSFFVGGALGSYAGAWGFEHFQWLGVCVLGLVSQIIALLAFWWGHKA